MLSQDAVAVIKIEPRALAEWAASRPEVVPAGWGCPDIEAALSLIRSNPSFARRLAGMYICAHTPAATPLHERPAGVASQRT